MRFKCFLAVIGLGLLFGPATGQALISLPPGNAVDRAAPASRPANLEERWKQLTGGAAVWRRADANDALRQVIFDMVADKVQSTNGEITREQFLAMNNRPTVAAGKPAVVAEQPKVKERGSLISLLNQGPAAARPRESDDGPVPGAEAEFRRCDRNNDGLLDYDEMDEALRAERDRWDANQDGFIDLGEFKAYLRARRRLERETAGQPAPRPAEEKRPAKARRAPPADDLPAKLPDWFREYDHDGDGQIGLYEWIAAGQPLARFREMDDNRDGFLTPDEVLAALHRDEEPPKDAKVAKEQRRDNNESPDGGAARALRMMMKERVILMDANQGVVIQLGK
jgi:Ca2+-binding EF-hand superfamily protein